MNERSIMTMQTKFEERREKSIAQISTAALKVFSEVGYDKASIRLIAKEANVALGLLYNYFPSKEALLESLLLSCLQDITLLQTADEEKAGYTLKEFIRQLIKKVKLNRISWKLYFSLRFQTAISREIDAVMQEQMRDTLQLLEHCLAEAAIPFPGMEAKFIWASLNGLITQYLLENNYPLDDMAQLLILKYEGK